MQNQLTSRPKAQPPKVQPQTQTQAKQQDSRYSFSQSQI